MAGDFNKPALSDGYSAFAQAVRDIVADVIKGLDPALSLGTSNTPTNAIRWTSASGKWQKYNGSSWGDLAATYAIAISGNAATASAWATGRTIALTGDVTGTSAAWTGSGNISFAATLANSGATAGTYNNAATAITPYTIDAKGRITGTGAAVTITPAWGSITGKPTTVAGYGITDMGSQSVNYAASSGTASHVAGGAAGQILYQSGAGATAKLALGSSGYVLTAGASAPQYVAQSALSVGSATTATNATNVTGTVAGSATGTTQTAGDNSTKIATTAYADAAAAAAGASAKSVPVRQTVLSGPVDAGGLPSFGGGTGSTTVTASGTLVAAAANGYGGIGGVDRVGQITNPSWTGLSTNGTTYLYLDVASDGSCTTGSTTLAPNYQWGGAYSITSGQFTFNIQEMVGKVGNGSAAVQAYRVFVGDVTVAGGVVTAITWYALAGRFVSAYTSPLPGTNTQVSTTHNLGVTIGVEADYEFECTSADIGYAVGDTVTGIAVQASFGAPITVKRAAKTMGFNSGLSGIVLVHGTSGTNVYPTAAKWKYRGVARRCW